MAMISAVFAANLVPDPEFKKADFKPLPKDTTWLWYQISAPSKAELLKGRVSMTGGKTFLHSSAFDVEPGKKYEVSLKASGKGQVSVEFLWWETYNDMGIKQAEPHRTIPVEPTEIKGGEKELKGAGTAPKKAKRAYIRVVVEKGSVTVSNPKVETK
jgi:hypothetical protein